MPATLSKSARRAPESHDPELEDGSALEEAPEDVLEVEQAGDDDVSEEEEDGQDEGDEDLEDEGEPGQKTFVRLATEINDCQREILNSDRRVVKLALQAGELLLEAKRRLAGRWLEWLHEHIDLGERQVQRYMRLAHHRQQLDEFDPKWMVKMSLNDVLECITSLSDAAKSWREADRGDSTDTSEDEADGTNQGADGETDDEASNERDPDDETSDGEEEDDEQDWDEEVDDDAEEPEEAEEDGEHQSTSDAAAQYRSARREHVERCRRFDGFLDAKYLKFSRNTSPSRALDTVTATLVKAARRAARPLVSREMKADDFDADYVAMSLVARLLKDGDVKTLFAPSKP